ncbi:hypothetical protein VTN77DRAFT_2298 [Rasamsonia byssochlamydoides]|uniref:uncharacterized protein n=1 Tax=Rasamsonia byssochlamydoides TaxID=89139 RepID=UPI0037448172
MGSRKQVKSNPSAADSQVSLVSSKSSASASTQPAKDSNSSAQKQNSRAGWYTKSWPQGKAAAVTEVARESILALELAPSTTSPPETSKAFKSRSIQLTKKAGSSSRSLPAETRTTRINIASNGSTSTTTEAVLHEPTPDAPRDETKDERDCPLDADDTVKDTKESPKATAVSQSGNTEVPPQESDNTSKPSDQSTSWFSWFGWGAAPAEKSSSKEMGTTKPPPAEAPSAAPTENPVAPSSDTRRDEPAILDASATTSQPEQPAVVEGSISTPQRRSWLQMWTGYYSTTATPKSKEELQQDESTKEPCPEAERPATQDINLKPTPNDAETGRMQENEPSKRQSAPGRSSGWAFWSRDVPKTETAERTDQKEASELATTEPTPLRPKQDFSEAEVEIQPKSGKSSTKSKAAKDTAEGAAAAVSPVDMPSPPVPAKVKAQEVSASKQLQSVLTNQLLPLFRDTFAMQESPSWLQSIGRILHYSKEPENKHVLVLRDPPRPKRALAIGVHGYFPAPLIRTVLGQPTGTSLKFSTMAAKAIHQWAENHGYQCNVEKISLEGEGRIAERVDLLWKLLLNWMEDIRKADFIMFACHSQGVPVTVMLVAKLIAFGCLNACRIGICAMAGVNLGPFPDYKSRWIGGSAGELFDFALPSSKVSRDYEAALEAALNFGVRIAYVGSIDDQLVSLESSLFTPASHPYIYRAVFVDGRVHTPSFLSHLVGFTLKLRNLGISDHGLIRELSAPLVGSLYSGEGHSRLHDEESIYYLAIEFALETSNVSGVPLRIQRTSPSATPNPYILPFAMRGILEEDYVRRELHEESMELLRQFDDWKPTTKVLKDVKFRLEGIRSKL